MVVERYRGAAVRLVAGVMSGTSLDGVDVAFVEISGGGDRLQHRLVGFHEAAMPEAIRSRLLDASAGDMLIRPLAELNVDLGHLYADAIEEGGRACGVDPTRVDAVGLHGQTIYHDPRRSPHGVTMQLGDAAVVAVRLATIVVNDFRSGDVALGGEGAPLVPYCDYVFFRSTEYSRIALNIGGIANITWLPKDVRPETLVAFDTGPGNMMIDAAMAELYGRRFDSNGAVAASGNLHDALLAELLANDYFATPPPKSSGREQFGREQTVAIVASARERNISPEDIIATLTHLTVRTIANGTRRFASGATATVDEIIVGGGGARNGTLMSLLAEAFPGCGVVPTDTYGIPSNAKEAICFAILANEALLEIPSNVPSVTGASRPVVSGAIRIGA